MFMTDRVSVGRVRRTADGYLVADAKVARTGIQLYSGAEVGRPEMDVVRVYRPPEEVFSEDTMHSFAYRPMTNGHPAKMVDASTWKAVAVGQTGGEVVRDGEFVRVPLVLMDASAIKDYESGKRELSMGYHAELVFGDGVTPDGQAYDAVQKDIRNNHLALCERARGGNELRIGDRRTPGGKDRADNPSEDNPMNEVKTRTILVDGLSVETTDAGAQAIQKLQGDLQAARQATADAETAHASALAAKDAQIARAEAERDAAQAKVLSDAALDARVQARADLVATAKALHDADYAGKSDAEIRKAVVVAKFGDAAVKDKSEAYIDARFDILADEAKKDPVHRALRDGARSTTTSADNGYADSVKELEQGRNGKKEG